MREQYVNLICIIICKLLGKLWGWRCNLDPHKFWNLQSFITVINSSIPLILIIICIYHEILLFYSRQLNNGEQIDRKMDTEKKNAL